MTLKKNDFIELEFTGRVKDGEIFDSNIKEDLKKINSKSADQAKPFAFALGQGMFLQSIDDFLIGKPEISKSVEYEIELSPEKAFGNRDRKLIERMPLKVFREHNLRPVPGFSFNFDGRMGRVLASSGGRVIVDFNNPVAGKDVKYKLRLLRKIESLEEKAKALINFLFRRDLDFEIKDKKITLSVEKQTSKFAELFKEKFKEILNLNLEVKEKTEENSQNKSN